MANFARHNQPGRNLDLISDDGIGAPDGSGLASRILHVARELSTATSQREIWTIARQFLSQEIAPCKLEKLDASVANRQAMLRLGRRPGLDTSSIHRHSDTTRVVTPLRYGEQTQGWWLIEFVGDVELPASLIALIELVAFTCSGEVVRVTNTRNRRDNISDLNYMRSLESQIADATGIQSIGNMIDSELSKVVNCSLISILTVQTDPRHLEVVAYRGAEPVDMAGYRVPISGSKVGQVFTTGESLVHDDVLQDDGAFAREDAYWRSVMIAPLVSGQETYGVILIGHQEPAMYGERELRLVELTAGQIANALYRLLEDERERTQYRAAIEALSAAVDTRDPYTHAHSRRVAELARRLAIRLRMSPAEVEQVELAGLLHDIGKIAIPDRVLTKPGGLTSEERMIMMNHADLGAKIVGSNPTLSGLTPMVRHHHEWYDGRGYPDGLRGDELPVEAAVLSIADAVETMTSHRVYRPALTLTQAREQLIAGRSSQFHPDVVDEMLWLIDFDPVVRQMLTDTRGEREQPDTLSPIRISDVADLQILTRIATEIGTLTEIHTFLDHVHKIVREELNLADVVIWLLDELNNRYFLAAGETDLPAPETLSNSSIQVRGQYVPSKEAVVLSRVDSDGISDRTVLFPMYVEDSLIGLIELVLAEEGQVDNRDVDLLQAIAGPVASTVRVAQLHDEAKRAAITDGLTGVLNHRAFYHELERRVARQPDGERTHLLIVDVIDLKLVNDTYGHLMGDAALKAVADAIVNRLRAEDVVARYGGDEFAAILRGPLDTPVEEIVARIEQPVYCQMDHGEILTVRLRCGAAESAEGDTRATELVARADALLYQRDQATYRERYVWPASDKSGGSVG